MYIKQSLHLEANRRSAGQNNPHILYTQKVQYLDNKHPPLDTFVGQLNPVSVTQLISLHVLVLEA
jgi:hypothetical protein